MFAKEDNPAAYEAVKMEMKDRRGLIIGSLRTLAITDESNRSTFEEIRVCTGSHNEVASIAYKILRGKYVCATANGKLWYRFDGALWREDKEAICVRHELSTTVHGHFMMALNAIASASFSEMDDARSTTSLAASIMTSASTRSAAGANEARAITERLLRRSFRLKDAGYKESVMREMREYFYDGEFLQRLDAAPHLVAFTNGVWDFLQGRFRSAVPDDCCSISTGYAYAAEDDSECAERVNKYWETLHPDADQRLYMQRMFARQLFGDHGQELFHIHAGYQASASNGKSKFFDVMEHCLGGYVRKFGVEMLTAKVRPEPGKPMPEFAFWRGVRVLYCTEPNHDDVVNSGILKDLSGGEAVMYRLLFSNDVLQFRPQFKLHMMCNDTPQLDGGDSGVKRRTRKVDYVSMFVDPIEADPAAHKYARDAGLIQAFKESVPLRLAFCKVLLRAYRHDWTFEMPEVVRMSSRSFIEDSDAVHKFVNENIERKAGGWFALADARELFKTCDYYNRKPKTFKTDLQKLLGVACYAQKRFGGRNETNVFEGFVIKRSNLADADDM
jgi:phage/plasmid-associated DNA primase